MWRPTKRFAEFSPNPSRASKAVQTFFPSSGVALGHRRKKNMKTLYFLAPQQKNRTSCWWYDSVSRDDIILWVKESSMLCEHFVWDFRFLRNGALVCMFPKIWILSAFLLHSCTAVLFCKVKYLHVPCVLVCGLYGAFSEEISRRWERGNVVLSRVAYHNKHQAKKPRPSRRCRSWSMGLY